MGLNEYLAETFSTEAFSAAILSTAILSTAIPMIAILMIVFSLLLAAALALLFLFRSVLLGYWDRLMLFWRGHLFQGEASLPLPSAALRGGRSQYGASDRSLSPNLLAHSNSDSSHSDGDSYGSFLPPEFISYVGKKSVGEISLGDNIELRFAILVADIHSYTAISENMSPSESFNFINSYLKSVAPAINEFNGFIIKYMGDGFMALFSKPSDAIEAAIGIQERLNRYNLQFAGEHKEPIRTGIGVHVGSGCLGAIGMPGRMQADIISDAVNLVTRIEALTRTYGCRILASEHLSSLLKETDSFKMRLLDKVQVKGKSNYVQVAEVISPQIDENAELKIRTRHLFDLGFHHLHEEKRYVEAINFFEEVIRIDPKDRAAQVLLDRATYYALNEFGEEWENSG